VEKGKREGREKRGGRKEESGGIISGVVK